jgi:hypothetical protein
MRGRQSRHRRSRLQSILDTGLSACNKTHPNGTIGPVLSSQGGLQDPFRL